MWDEHKHELFDLRALLFVTINDWPAISNFSVQTNKGYNACTHYLDETDITYLEKCKKVVYLGHRRFLPPRHLARRRGNHFKLKCVTLRVREHVDMIRSIINSGTEMPILTPTYSTKFLID